jgi:hypothetical protein
LTTVENCDTIVLIIMEKNLNMAMLIEINENELNLAFQGVLEVDDETVIINITENKDWWLSKTREEFLIPHNELQFTLSESNMTFIENDIINQLCA